MKCFTVGFLALAGIAVGTACMCAVGSRFSMVHVDMEEVAIIYDAKNETEHFIRKAYFGTNAPDFAFIAPTPSRPELGEADPALLSELSKFVPHPPVTGSKGRAGALGGGSDPGVQVVMTRDVAGMRATILKARKANDLKAWLTTNGYATPAGFTEWVRPYLSGDWHLTAFKFLRTGKSNEVSSKAIRMTFKTSRPYYPYRIPKAEDASGRNLRVYVVAPFAVDAKAGTEPRTRQLYRAGVLPEGTMLKVASLGQIDPDRMPAKGILTIFEDDGSERADAGDLWFSASTWPRR